MEDTDELKLEQVGNDGEWSEWLQNMQQQWIDFVTFMLMFYPWSEARHCKKSWVVQGSVVAERHK